MISEEQKTTSFRLIVWMRNIEEKTDGNKVADLYMKMEKEIEGGIC